MLFPFTVLLSMPVLLSYSPLGISKAEVPGSIINSRRLLQDLKMFEPIVVTEPGIEKVEKLQLEKQLSPNLVILLGNVIWVRLLQFANALFPISVMLLGNVIWVRLLHL